jgi:hypothetical protein
VGCRTAELVELRSKVHRNIKDYVQNSEDTELFHSSAYANLWDKYVQLRRKVHTLAAAKKKSFYQSLLTKLETEFVSDRSQFYKEIVKLRRKGQDQSFLLNLKSDPSLPDSDVTSKPDDIKRILFDLHSSLGRHDRNDSRFDVNHLQEIKQMVNLKPSNQIGPDFCERTISL